MGVKGQTINVLLGESFTNGTGGFVGISAYGTVAIVNGRLEHTVVSLNDATRIEKILPPFNIGDKMYITAKINPKYSTSTRISLGGQTAAQFNPTPNIDNKYSAIITTGNNTDPLRLYHSTITDYSIDDKFSFDDVMVINLTRNGLESLTKEECDARFGFMPTGTKSTVSGGRLRSIGKNLFDGEFEIGSLASSGLNTNDATRIRSKYFVPVSPNTQYTLSSSSDSSIAWGWFYDSNYKPISNSVSKTFITPAAANIIDGLI